MANIQNVTDRLMDEHQLILRMLDLLEAQADAVERGAEPDAEFLAAAIDFVRRFADRFHHAKEEDILFAALVDNGMPAEHSPVAAMLMEHEQGRQFLRGLEEALSTHRAGSPGQLERIVENARGYCALLRDHIDKEDHILYPLAERILPAAGREGLLAAYAAAEALAPSVPETARELVCRYETSSAA